MQPARAVSRVAVAVAALALGCAAPEAGPAAGEAPMSAQHEAFRVTSPAFAEGEAIPPRFTADGADISPELVLQEPPPGTASFALVMDDPDAPVGTWVHWVAWNIPAGTTTIAEGTLPGSAVSGRNSWGRTGYGGPAPPSGTHRYVFKLYALDTSLDLPPSSDKAALERAIEGHVLARATLIGTYSRG